MKAKYNRKYLKGLGDGAGEQDSQPKIAYLAKIYFKNEDKIKTSSK